MNIQRIISTCFIVITLVACTANEEPMNEQSTPFPEIEQSSNVNERNVTNNDIANHLANVAKQVPDVEEAYAIIAGPYAIVAIDVDAETKKQRVGTIKYSVGEALRDDPYGKTAVVVADADVTERVREMRQKMEEGHVVHGVVDELAEIVARYMPLFPVEQDPPVEQENNMMQSGEEEENVIEEDENIIEDNNRPQ